MGITDRSRAGISKAEQARRQARLDSKSSSESESNVTKKDVDNAYNNYCHAHDLWKKTGDNQHWQYAQKLSRIYETLERKLAKGE